MEQRQHQNPDPLETEGSATRKSEPENQHRHSALTYWSGIIDRMHSSRRKMGKGCATRRTVQVGRCRRKQKWPVAKNRNGPLEFSGQLTLPFAGGLPRVFHDFDQGAWVDP